MPNNSARSLTLLLSCSLSRQSFTPLSLHCQQSQLKSPNCASPVSLGRASQYNARSGSKTQLIRLPRSLSLSHSFFLTLALSLLLFIALSVCVWMGPQIRVPVKTKWATSSHKRKLTTAVAMAMATAQRRRRWCPPARFVLLFYSCFRHSRKCFLILMQVSHTAAVFYVHIKSPVLFIFVWYKRKYSKLLTNFDRLVAGYTMLYFLYIVFSIYILAILPSNPVVIFLIYKKFLFDALFRSKMQCENVKCNSQLWIVCHRYI